MTISYGNLPGGVTCPAPMTRAALLALRTAGTLNASCHYVITDFVQGRFLAGTTITMHADSATELSMSASLNSLYDDGGWACLYDIDTNNLTMVTDNLDNVVESSVVGRVAAFDWGNPAYTNNRIQGTLTLTIGATHPFIGNTIVRYATVDLTGRTGGSITDTYVKGQLALANSNLTILRSNIDTNSAITATGYVSGGAGIINARLAGTSGIVLGAGSGVVSITNLEMVNGNGARINHTGTGALTIGNSQIENTANVLHSSTGALTISGSKLHGLATSVAHSTGTGALTIIGCELGPYARVLKDDPASTGVTTLNYSKIGTGGYVFARGANTLDFNYSEINGSQGVVTNAGSNTPTSVLYCTLNSGSTIAVGIAATSTAGSFQMAYTQCSNNGFTQKTGIGNTIISQCLLQGTGRVIHAGARHLTVTSSTFSDRVIFTHNSTVVGDVPDAITDNNFRSGAAINITNTGAVSTQMGQCEISQSSMLNIGGTTTGAVLTALSLTGQSTATFNNNTAAMPLCLYNDISAASVLDVSGNTASKDIRSNTVRGSSTLAITNNTVANPVHANDLSAVGRLNVTAAAGPTSYNKVSRGGVLTTSGGTVNYNFKALGSTWNTGGFNVIQCINETNVNVTLTANNTARATRIGVTNTVPLI